MNIEIERKFLVNGKEFETEAVRVYPIEQGYICTEKESTVRVRTRGKQAYITIKGKAPSGYLGRAEYEYEIPYADAEKMLSDLCGTRRIQKDRYIVPYAGFTWEVDVFHGRHEGLIVAEIELPDENAVFEKPAWIGLEVTGDGQYSNAALARR